MFKLFLGLTLLLFPLTTVHTADEQTNGAFYTNHYPNRLKEWGLSDEMIQQRIDATWHQLFYGDDADERVYYPVGEDMAYILDVNNDDVRSEGISYGMMIAVQMDKQTEFNRLWTWAKRHMQHQDGQYAGYFSWQNLPDGKMLDTNSAPDGETWIVMSLFFAAARWGNGEGIYNYQAEANTILHAMLHKSNESSLLTNMFDREHKMVVFVPRVGALSQFTDPSYHTPFFYELWARWAEQDNDFWYDAAQASRDFWRTTAHPETGLMPNYAEFTGQPRAMQNYGEYFYADAWRCAMNVAVDFAWFGVDDWQVEQSNRLLTFFHDLGIGQYNSRFTIDGEPHAPHHRSVGLIAMNATASLAASDEIKWDFIKEFWETDIPSGQYRYYDGLLYMMALLHLSGNFQIYHLDSGI